MEPILEISTRITTLLWHIHALNPESRLGRVLESDWKGRLTDGALRDYSRFQGLLDLAGMETDWNRNDPLTRPKIPWSKIIPHYWARWRNRRVPLRFAVGHSSARTISEAAQLILEQVGLSDKAALSPKGLTQVELRKLELGRALAAQPKLLIADEVMAGLSESEVDEILALLNRLNSEGISILLIEHIMRAVMLFSQRIVVIVAGCKIADGLPDDVMKQEDVERAYLGE